MTCRVSSSISLPAFSVALGSSRSIWAAKKRHRSRASPRERKLEVLRKEFGEHGLGRRCEFRLRRAGQIRFHVSSATIGIKVPRLGALRRHRDELRLHEHDLGDRTGDESRAVTLAATWRAFSSFGPAERATEKPSVVCEKRLAALRALFPTAYQRTAPSFARQLLRRDGSRSS